MTTRPKTPRTRQPAAPSGHGSLNRVGSASCWHCGEPVTNKKKDGLCNHCAAIVEDNIGTTDDWMWK